MDNYVDNGSKSLTLDDIINLRNQTMLSEESWPLDKFNIPKCVYSLGKNVITPVKINRLVKFLNNLIDSIKKSF